MHPLKKFTVKYKLGSTIKVSMIVKHYNFDEAMLLIYQNSKFFSSKNQLTTTSNSFFHIAQKKFTVPLPSTWVHVFERAPLTAHWSSVRTQFLSWVTTHSVAKELKSETNGLNLNLTYFQSLDHIFPI